MFGLTKVAVKWLDMLREGKLGNVTMSRLTDNPMSFNTDKDDMAYYMQPNFKGEPINKKNIFTRDAKDALDRATDGPTAGNKKLKYAINNRMGLGVPAKHKLVITKATPPTANPQSNGVANIEYNNISWGRGLPGSYSEHNELLIPNIREVVDKDRALGVARHEAAHKAIHTRIPQQESMATVDRVGKAVGPLFPKHIINNKHYPGLGVSGHEMLAQWYGGQGTTRGAKAILNLPVQNLQQVDPEFYEKAMTRFRRLSPGLRQKLMSVVGHLRTNYHLR